MKKIFSSMLSLLSLITYGQDPKVLDDKTLLVNRIFLDEYHKMSPDSLIQVFLPIVWSERDSLMARHSPNLDEQSAIHHYYGQALFSLSESLIRSIGQDKPWKQLADIVFQKTALPSLDELEQSNAAGLFLESYMRHRIRELFLQAKEERGKEDAFMEQQFGMPVDSLKAFAAQHGDLALGLLYAKKILTPPLVAYYLSRQLSKQIERKNLGLATFVLKELKESFPEQPSVAQAEQSIANLEKLLVHNAENPNIVFIEYPESIRSVADLVAPYAGKVIYLDIWGTWCGPCVMEMTQYTQTLKNRFKDEEDIVFLYLAMETPFDIEKWKEFILIHNLSGYHLAMTNTDIEPFWIELLGTRDVPRSYPTYMIFDRKGELVNTEACRPSHSEALYLQLEEVLNR